MDFYTAIVTRRIADGIPHATIGNIMNAEANSPQPGFDEFKKLVRMGLQTHHTVVDFGCGSLRIGQHLIRFLDPGGYWGLDVTDSFTKMGIAQLGNDLIEEKGANFRIINPEVCRQVREAQPDFLYCRAVIRHVPPEDLGDFFDTLMSTLVHKTITLVSCLAAKRTLRISGDSWAHSIEALAGHVKRCKGHLEIETKHEKDVTLTRAPVDYRSIKLHISLNEA